MYIERKWKPATLLKLKAQIQNKRGAIFQIIKLLFVIQKMRVQVRTITKNACLKQARPFFDLLIINKYYTLKI